MIRQYYNLTNHKTSEREQTISFKLPFIQNQENKILITKENNYSKETGQTAFQAFSVISKKACPYYYLSEREEGIIVMALLL